MDIKDLEQIFFLEGGGGGGGGRVCVYHIRLNYSRTLSNSRGKDTGLRISGFEPLKELLIWCSSKVLICIYIYIHGHIHIYIWYPHPPRDLPFLMPLNVYIYMYILT